MGHDDMWDSREAYEREKIREDRMIGVTEETRAECDRLRGLLSIARDELYDIAHESDILPNGLRVRAETALRRSNPDTTPEGRDAMKSARGRAVTAYDDLPESAKLALEVGGRRSSWIAALAESIEQHASDALDAATARLAAEFCARSAPSES